MNEVKSEAINVDYWIVMEKIDIDGWDEVNRYPTKWLYQIRICKMTKYFMNDDRMQRFEFRAGDTIYDVRTNNLLEAHVIYTKLKEKYA
jgi:hypothetical protein